MVKRQSIVNLLPELRAHVARKFKTQTAAAASWGCSRAFVCAVLSGKKEAPDWMLDDAGIEKVKTTVYVRKDEKFDL